MMMMMMTLAFEPTRAIHPIKPVAWLAELTVWDCDDAASESNLEPRREKNWLLYLYAATLK